MRADHANDAISRNASPKRVLVGLWMSGVLGQDIIDGIHAWLRESGAAWRIRFADSGQLFASSLIWMLREGVLGGVISFYHEPAQLDAMRRARVPVVLFGEHPVDSPPASPLPPLRARVELDLAAVACAAADHLLSRADFRTAGYVESHFDHGWSRHRGDAVVADIPKPAAVVAASDATADDVIRVCEPGGIAVPRDVAVLGMDDNPVFCRHSEPNISSVHFDGRRAGLLAAKTLAAMMDGLPAPSPETLRYSCTPIAKRGSTAATPSIGEIVQKALDYIDANACSGATLDDVVRHCRHSRTLVTMRFRQMTGKSVVEAIRNRRLDEARRLLRETSLPAEEIASLCGYESASTLSRAFAKATGLTPGAWRRQP